MKRLSCLLLAALLMPALAGAAEPDRTPFPFVKALAAHGARSNTLGSTMVDEDVLEATDNHYANLRVLMENQTEAPFLVRPQRVNRRGTQEAEVPVETAALRTRADNSIEILLRRAPDTEAPAAFQFASPERNFEKSVSVEGSADGSAWAPLAVAKPIFDYSRFLDVRNARVEIPASPCTQYRIIISNIVERTQSPMVQLARDTRDGKLVSEVENTSFLRNDFRIDRIRAFAQRPTELRAELITRNYTVSDLSVTNDAKEKISLITFRTARAPLTELTLLVDDPNFSRTCTLEAKDAVDAAAPWTAVLSCRLTRVRAGHFQMENTCLTPGGPCRFRVYRLTIRNQDSPPLRVKGVAAKGEVRELVFFADPSQAYRLLYGGDDIPAPQYDIGDVLANAETAAMDAYLAGDQKANPDYRPGERKRFKLDGRKLMAGAIVLMVAVLGWIIIAAARRLGPSPEP